MSSGDKLESQKARLTTSDLWVAIIALELAFAIKMKKKTDS